jgi:hypothetical protein
MRPAQMNYDATDAVPGRMKINARWEHVEAIL